MNIPEIKIFKYIQEGDFFVETPEYRKLAEKLGLTEWNGVVWIGRLFCMDNDFGEHWFDNWEAREMKSEIIEKLGYDQEEALFIEPEIFKDGKDGPCHTDEFRKQFWTDVLKNLTLGLDTIIQKAIIVHQDKSEGTEFPVEDRIKEVLEEYGAPYGDFQKHLEKSKPLFSKEIIDEIASDLQMGLRCFINVKTLEHLVIADEFNPYSDMELWQDELDKLEENRSDYIEIERMTSSDSFRIMEGFIETVTDARLKEKLISALNRSKPFRHFKHEIENSGDWREKWFKFRDQYYFNWVSKQIKKIN